MVTTGAMPTESLPITRLPEPVSPPKVCEATTETDPLGKPLTLRPAVTQRPLLHCAEADMDPMPTSTPVPLAVQVPETV